MSERTNFYRVNLLAVKFWTNIMSASSPIWEMTKNQYSCEIIRPENFKQVMGAFSIALILSVPGTDLRICAFLQVVCAVETQFLPLCASWLE